MRAFVQHCLPFAVVGLAAVLAGRALAQPAPAPTGAPDHRLEAAAIDALVSKANETPEEAEEITVEGQRRGNVLGKYRLEMTKARDDIVEAFNKVNSNDGTDVKCRTEKPTGTRLGHSVCRSKAEDAADASAAKGMLQGFVRSTTVGAGFAGEAGFEPVGPAATPGTVGGIGAQGEGAGGTDVARDKLEAEMKKMMEQNRELFRAVVKYVEVRDDYDKAREKSGAAVAN